MSTEREQVEAKWPEVFVARFRSLDGRTEHEMVGPRRAAEMGDEAERYLPASTVQGLVDAAKNCLLALEQGRYGDAFAALETEAARAALANYKEAQGG